MAVFEGHSLGALVVWRGWIPRVATTLHPSRDRAAGFRQTGRGGGYVPYPTNLAFSARRICSVALVEAAFHLA